MRFLLVLLIWLVLPAALRAEPVTIHVDAVNGSDSGDGSEANPLATIGAALALAVAGDEIEVAAGVYLEDVVAKDEVDLVGAGADVTVLDGVLTCAAARVEGFELRLGGSCAASARIERNLVRGTLVVSAAGVEITGNVFLAPLSASTDGAIHTVAATAVTITGNTFYGTYGINLDASSEALIANNVLVHGRRGIELATGASAEIRSNDVFDNRLGIIGFRADYVGIENQTGIAGNLSVEPSFVDPEEGDFRLRPNSPLIDAGSNPDVTLDQDIDGSTRIVDGDGDTSAVVDAGAQEFDPDEVLPLDVAIDLLPGKLPNEVKARRIVSEKPDKHKLAVAIVSSPEFSAPDEADPETLRLGTFGGIRCRAKDANRDDRDDLVCKFPAAGISIGFFPIETPTACIRGETFAGRKLLGCDEVEIVP